MSKELRQCLSTEKAMGPAIGPNLRNAIHIIAQHVPPFVFSFLYEHFYLL